jgi:SAM-dependent methyltransferase
MGNLNIEDVKANLSYFVEWRPALWAPAVNWLIGDPMRFAGKRVLDLGCRYGRMSCLFGLLDATVTGVELEGVSLARAWREVDHWNLRGQVQFFNYDGHPLNIPGRDYDFILTKSVLVVVPNLDRFLFALSHKLRADGELMMAENLAGGAFLNFLRRVITHRRFQGLEDRFHGVDADFLAMLSQTFDIIGFKTFYGIVSAIRGQKKPCLDMETI